MKREILNTSYEEIDEFINIFNKVYKEVKNGEV